MVFRYILLTLYFIILCIILFIFAPCFTNLITFMSKDSILKKRASSISFVEVNVLPPQSEKFYQLVRDGNPTRFVYSESHLFKCLEALEISFGL